MLYPFEGVLVKWRIRTHLVGYSCGWS